MTSAKREVTSLKRSRNNMNIIPLRDHVFHQLHPNVADIFEHSIIFKLCCAEICVNYCRKNILFGNFICNVSLKKILSFAPKRAWYLC